MEDLVAVHPNQVELEEEVVDIVVVEAQVGVTNGVLEVEGDHIILEQTKITLFKGVRLSLPTI